jgi:protein involved in polysaccharide export with SLBB domain
MRSEPARPPAAGEFERFVQSHMPSGAEIRRFGAELVLQYQPASADASVPVPPDYLLSPGDEVVLTIWGSVDADLRLPVDRSGRINIPRVGAVLVAGVRHQDLPKVISERVERVFKNFQLSATVGALRGIRVFVTGFAAQPGMYQLNSLSTLSSALFRAGGPSASGSFRHIELRRGGKAVATFDLYDLLLKGERNADAGLQAGDVVHVHAVGTEVALIGSVNRPAVFELKPGETLTDVVRMAAGFSAVADRSRVSVERLSERSTGRVRELKLPADMGFLPERGDLIRAFSSVDALLPQQLQNKRVRIEGEVARPGDYVLPPGSTLQDALAAAGGLTNSAFVFGTDFSRVKVRQSQTENYERALRDLETDLARSTTVRAGATADEANAATSRAAGNNRLLERLRALQPSGRVVLQLEPDARELPALVLEDGDRIAIPSKPLTVGVFGSVFNAGSYLHSEGRAVRDYLRLAGGPTQGADETGVFVIRANGTVESRRQRGNTGWLQRDSGWESLAARPGDTIFVPEDLDRTTFVQAAKDWTQILYQFGLGIAGLVSASR